MIKVIKQGISREAAADMDSKVKTIVEGILNDIDARGDAYPCVFSRFACVGNLLDHSLQEVVRGDRLHTFRTEAYLR